MLSEPHLKEHLKHLLKDERLYYKIATVFENASLALVQLKLETQINTIEQVLELPKTNFRSLREQQNTPEVTEQYCMECNAIAKPTCNEH